MFIDFTWTQGIFGIIAWTQDDEMVVNDEMVLEVHATHDMHKGDHDETVQTVDKSLFHTIACTNNDVSMFVVVNDDLVGGHMQKKIDIRNRTEFQAEVRERIDGLFSKLFQILSSQISILKMIRTMKQYWFHGKIQHWKQVHQIHERKQSFVFQQQIFRQQLRIEHLLLKKRQKINMNQHRFQWVQPTASPIISRRLQLHKMTQWLMCKLIRSPQNFDENQMKIRLHIILWIEHWTIQVETIDIWILCFERLHIERWTIENNIEVLMQRECVLDDDDDKQIQK